jgi:hypothetical protein
VQLAHQHLEFRHLAPGQRRSRITRFRREEADGVVAPVIGESLVQQKVLDIDFLYGRSSTAVVPSAFRYGIFSIKPRYVPGSATPDDRCAVNPFRWTS